MAAWQAGKNKAGQKAGFGVGFVAVALAPASGLVLAGVRNSLTTETPRHRV